MACDEGGFTAFCPEIRGATSGPLTPQWNLSPQSGREPRLTGITLTTAEGNPPVGSKRLYGSRLSLAVPLQQRVIRLTGITVATTDGNPPPESSKLLEVQHTFRRCTRCLALLSGEFFDRQRRKRSEWSEGCASLVDLERIMPKRTAHPAPKTTHPCPAAAHPWSQISGRCPP